MSYSARLPRTKTAFLCIMNKWNCLNKYAVYADSVASFKLLTAPHGQCWTPTLFAFIFFVCLLVLTPIPIPPCAACQSTVCSSNLANQIQIIHCSWWPPREKTWRESLLYLPLCLPPCPSHTTLPSWDWSKMTWQLQLVQINSLRENVTLCRWLSDWSASRHFSRGYTVNCSVGYTCP